MDTMTQETVGTLELTDLEDMLLDENLTPCDFKHSVTSCSNEVMARLTFCQGAMNLCERANERIIMKMTPKAPNRPVICAYCNSHIELCWVLNPA